MPANQRPDYHKWARFYLDFCTKYGHSPALPTSLGPFLTKLAAKSQSVGQRCHASAAVQLLIQAGPEPGATAPPLRAMPARSPRPTLNCNPSTLSQILRSRSSPLPPPVPRSPQPPPPPPVAQRRIPDPPVATRQDRPIAPVAQSDGALSVVLAAALTQPPAPGHGTSWEQEYRDLEGAIRLRNYSIMSKVGAQLGPRTPVFNPGDGPARSRPPPLAPRASPLARHHFTEAGAQVV